MSSPPFKLLVVLQNPYDKGALKGGWHPSRWYTEFSTSRTGRRLLAILPGRKDGWRVNFANANPTIGAGVQCHRPPNLAHLRQRLHCVAPDFVLACGRSAENAMLRLWPGPFVAIPHPAHRVLTNRLMDRARDLILEWAGHQSDPVELSRTVPRFVLRQRRGREELIDLTSSAGDDGIVAAPTGGLHP